MSVSGKSRGWGCGHLILLVITLWAVWSLAAGEPIWEWVKK